MRRPPTRAGALLLGRMLRRENDGWVLSRNIKWFWKRGPTSVPAKGVSTNVVGGLLRREQIVCESRKYIFQSTLYRVRQ